MSFAPPRYGLIGSGYRAAMREAAQRHQSEKRNIQAPRIHTNGALAVVIGGGGDGYISGFGVAGDYARRYDKSKFLTHLQVQANVDGVARTIVSQANGQPIVLVGHSWGGPQALRLANALTRRGGFVPIVVTADPVGGSYGVGAVPPPPQRSRWVNIRTTEPLRQFDPSDWVASIGGHPAALPYSRAAIDARLVGHHVDLETMMSRPIQDGKSAEDLIADHLPGRQR